MPLRRIIVDDRNINWKNQKSIDPVSDEHVYELNQIPFVNKIKHAARYFNDHCHNCYCRDGLVSPTSNKYSTAVDKSAVDERASTPCQCPLNHPCILSPAPFLRSKQTKTRFCIAGKYSLDDHGCKSNYCRDDGCFVESSALLGSDKTCGDVDYTDGCLKNRILNRQHIDFNRQIGCSGDLLTSSSNKHSLCGLSYTKQRDKYELHNKSTCCAALERKYTKRINPEEATQNISNIANFRDKHFFDTHNPFVDNNPLFANSSTQKLPPSHEDNELTSKHRCVYSFQLDSRLKPVPLNADNFGSSCCDICNKPMITKANNDNINTQQEIQKNASSQLNNANNKSGRTFSCITDNTSEQDKKEDSQKVHIGSGNERIQLTIPNGLFDASIGHSVEVTSFGSHPKATKTGKGAISWNSIGKGRAVSSAERPNSFALRQQKFSVRSK